MVNDEDKSGVPPCVGDSDSDRNDRNAATEALTPLEDSDNALMLSSGGAETPDNQTSDADADQDIEEGIVEARFFSDEENETAAEDNQPSHAEVSSIRVHRTLHSKHGGTEDERTISKIEHGSEDGTNDVSALQEQTVEAERLEEGLADAGEGRVVTDDSSVLSQYLWERLPVATPIFDADVVVWEYERPSFRKRFGRGIFRDRPPPTTSDDGPREPIFTDEDWSNPLRCLCKLIGTVLALPLYFLYLAFIRCVWVEPFCRATDYVVFRPVGWAIDCFIYAATNVFWAVYKVLLVPIYSALVYCIRLLRNCGLLLAKYILMPTEWTFRRMVLPVIREITNSIGFLYNKMVLPCMKSAWKGIQAICNAFLAGLRFVGRKVGKVTTLIYKKVVLPCAKGVRKGVRAICGALSAGLQFVGRQVEKITTLIWTRIIVPCYTGFASGVVYSHKHIILPMGRCLHTYLIQPFCSLTRWTGRCLLKYLIEPFCDLTWWMLRTAVKFAKAFHKCIILPLCHFTRSVAKGCYTYVITPAGRLVKSAAVAIKNAVLAITRAMNDYLFAPLGSFMSATIAGVVSIFKAMNLAVRNAFSALRKALSALWRI